MIEQHNQDYDIEKLWESLLPEWSSIIKNVVRTPESIEQIPDSPPEWIEMLSATKSELDNSIAKMWHGMPRFTRYLQASILDVGIGTSIGGTVLVYLLKDWKETDIEEYEPGLTIGGLPVTKDMLSRFQEENGDIPASLSTAWLAHSFFRLKSKRWLSSLRPEGEILAQKPSVISKPSRAWVNGVHERVECLEVFEPNWSISGCLVRHVGDRAWLDYVVYRERGGYIHNSSRSSIESTFTDWEVNEWAEP